MTGDRGIKYITPKPIAQFWTGVILSVALVIIILPAILLRAWVIIKLWSWYFIPAFGAPSLTMGAAFGMSLFVSFLRGKRKHDDSDWPKLLVESFVEPLVTLVIGYGGSFFV